MFNIGWNVMHQKWTFSQPSGLNIHGMFRFDIILTLNWDISYFMKTELLPSVSTAQTTSNVLTKFRIQMIHLAFSSECSMNIPTWTFIQFTFWTMRGSFLNVRPNIPGMFHECYRAHWAWTCGFYTIPQTELKYTLWCDLTSWFPILFINPRDQTMPRDGIDIPLRTCTSQQKSWHPEPTIWSADHPVHANGFSAPWLELHILTRLLTCLWDDHALHI